MVDKAPDRSEASDESIVLEGASPAEPAASTEAAGLQSAQRAIAAAMGGDLIGSPDEIAAAVAEQFTQALRNRMQEAVRKAIVGALQEFVGSGMVVPPAPPHSSSKPTDSQRKLPEIAPERYAQRLSRQEGPVEFLRRVWGPWIDRGLLYQFQLNRLDPDLLSSLKSYCQKRGQKASIYLPSKSAYVRERDALLVMSELAAS